MEYQTNVLYLQYYDIASGLHNLHKQQKCHRNIRAKSIHIDIENGAALLTRFGNLQQNVSITMCNYTKYVDIIRQGTIYRSINIKS